MRRMTALLVLMCLLPIGVLAEWVSIETLHTAAPDYWDGSCTIGKEEVPFHAPVYVPDVEKLPVVRATKLLLTQEDVEEYVFKDEGQRIECQPEERSITSEKASWTTEFLYSTWQEDIDPYTIYAENAGFSLGKAVDGLRAYVKLLYGDGVDIVPNRVTRCSAWREAGRQKAPTEHDPYTQRGSLTGLGSLSIEAWTTICGVPVLAGISHSLHDQTLIRHSKLKAALYRCADGRGTQQKNQQAQ